MIHLTTFISFCVLLAWRWQSLQRQARVPDRPFRTALKKELAAWALTCVVLAVGFVLLFVLADWFWPIPPVHEW